MSTVSGSSLNTHLFPCYTKGSRVQSVEGEVWVLELRVTVFKTTPNKHTFASKSLTCPMFCSCISCRLLASRQGSSGPSSHLRCPAWAVSPARRGEHQQSQHTFSRAHHSDWQTRRDLSPGLAIAGRSSDCGSKHTQEDYLWLFLWCQPGCSRVVARQSGDLKGTPRQSKISTPG